METLVEPRALTPSSAHHKVFSGKCYEFYCYVSLRMMPNGPRGDAMNGQGAT